METPESPQVAATGVRPTSAAMTNSTTVTQGGAGFAIASTVWGLAIHYFGLEPPPAEVVGGTVGMFTMLWQWVMK